MAKTVKVICPICKEENIFKTSDALGGKDNVFSEVKRCLHYEFSVGMAGKLFSKFFVHAECEVMEDGQLT